ncbi:MAG: hypothetical protein RIR70_1633 [Pseudomonadota bacterium]|jgi:cystathionine beta-lyase
MPAFDFDHPPERAGSDSSKWRKYAGRDIIPMWVSDMDFAAPPAVIEALRQRIDHGVFGYADPGPEHIEAVIEGIQRDHHWQIDKDWLVWLPGMVTGLNLACRAVGEPGDDVFTATPIYPPFLAAPGFSDRTLSTAPLQLSQNRWQWDWDAVRAALSPRTRLFMLCNPHNPVGRVFSREELTHIAALCEQHDIAICSDEIHCGLVLDPALTHTPIATLDEAIAQRTITLMAPSKTWNIPGLYCTLAIIPNAALRRRFTHAMRGIVPHVGVLGLTAAAAAYRHGTPWRRALIDYLRINRDLTLSHLNALGLPTAPIEATYLAWIDCRHLPDPVALFEHHGVGLSDGKDFGAPGFVRLNFGCPRHRLQEALSRMAHAVQSRHPSK